jgi:hypothetical protein
VTPSDDTVCACGCLTTTWKEAVSTLSVKLFCIDKENDVWIDVPHNTFLDVLDKKLEEYSEQEADKYKFFQYTPPVPSPYYFGYPLTAAIGAALQNPASPSWTPSKFVYSKSSAINREENIRRYEALTQLKKDQLHAFCNSTFSECEIWTPYRWEAFERYISTPNEISVLGPLVSRIPALKKIVELPCIDLPHTTHKRTQLQRMMVDRAIMHLNDIHLWNFNQIADWLDTLGLDFSFPMPDTVTGN